MIKQNEFIWIVVFAYVTVCVMSTRPNPGVYCPNVRKPANGDVRCSRCDIDEFLMYGGSSRSGSKSKESGSKSRNRDVYSCRFYCNKGFKLNGPSILECPFNVADNPTCTPVQCEALPWIDHGSLNCSNSFLFGSNCKYSCASGFNISGGSNTLTCGSDGLWSSAVPKCQPVQCPALSVPTHGSISCPGGRSFGADCRFTCDERYRLKGWPVLTCLENGQWTDQTPECQLGECVPLPFLVHGSLTCTKGWDSGSRCSYSCHHGYWLKGGSFVLSCGSNGYWRGDIPTCQKGFYTGNPADSELYGELTYEYDGVNEPAGVKAAVGTGPGDGGSSNGGGLSAGAIISLLAVAIIIVSVGVGLFVAYRHKKKTSRRNLLTPGNTDNSSYQTTE